MSLRKKLKSESQKTAHVGYAKLIYLVLFKFSSLYLFQKHSGAVHQKLSYGLFLLVTNQFTGKRSEMVFL